MSVRLEVDRIEGLGRSDTPKMLNNCCGQQFDHFAVAAHDDSLYGCLDSHQDALVFGVASHDNSLYGSFDSPQDMLVFDSNSPCGGVEALKAEASKKSHCELNVESHADKESPLVPSKDGHCIVKVVCEDLGESCDSCLNAVIDTSQSHGNLFEGLKVHDSSSNSNNSSNNTQLQLSRTPVAGNRSSLASSFGQVRPGDSPNRSGDAAGGTPTQTARSDGARADEANFPSLEREEVGKEGPTRSCSGTHVVPSSPVMQLSCDNLFLNSSYDYRHLMAAVESRHEPCVVSNVNKTTAQALSQTHCLQHPRKHAVVYNIPSTPSSSSTSADDDFDMVIRQQWDLHMVALGSLGRNKRWGGAYWKCWYDGVIIDGTEDRAVKRVSASAVDVAVKRVSASAVYVDNSAGKTLLVADGDLPSTDGFDANACGHVDP